MESASVQYPSQSKWYEIWKAVLYPPSEQAFLNILADPAVSARRAFIWVALAALAISPFQVFTTMVSMENSLDTALGLMVGLCAAVVFAPVGAVIGLAISAGLYHLIAGWFGGRGTFNEMTYAIGAVTAPYMLVAGLISAVTSLIVVAGEVFGLLMLCLVPIFLALPIYLIILYVQAIKAVEGLSTGKAVLTVVMPTAFVFVLALGCAFTFGAAAALIGL
jgi:hypothetical protein